MNSSWSMVPLLSLSKIRNNLSPSNPGTLKNYRKRKKKEKKTQRRENMIGGNYDYTRGSLPGSQTASQTASQPDSQTASRALGSRRFYTHWIEQ